MLDLNKKNYIVAEWFDGKLRSLTGIFQNLDNAKEALKQHEEVYKRYCAEQPNWVNAHQKSKPIIVIIDSSIME